MAEQYLDDAQFGAVLEQVRCKGVAQSVHRYFLTQAGAGGGFTAGQLQRSGADMAVLLPGREQKILRLEGQTVALQNGLETGESMA